MRKYLKYKDSEVQWIGEIPENWAVRRINSLFKPRSETVSDKDFSPLSVTKNGILPQIEGVAKTENNDARKLVRKGDFVINSRSDRKGSSGTSRYDGSVSVINIVLEPHSIDPLYAEFLFKSNEFVEEYFRNGKGIVWDLWSTRYSEMKYILIPSPPIPEQQQIVTYLNQKTTLIDQIISGSEKKLELLKEKRLSLIQDVILNSQVTRRRLLYGADVINRPISRSRNTHYNKVGLYNWGRGIFKYDEELGDELGDSEFSFIREGDLILSGQFSWEGAVALVDYKFDNCIASHRFHILNGKENILLTEYLWAYFTSQEGHFLLDDNSVGAAGRNRPLNIGKFLKEKIPFPDLNTQQRIKEVVLMERRLREYSEKLVSRLKEYRQSLISEVVTGKIKVIEDKIKQP
jgi:type I restriction enzyme S subunit